MKPEWTMVGPAEPGYYWYRPAATELALFSLRHRRSRRPMIVEVYDDGERVDLIGPARAVRIVKVNTLHGEWFGPIAPPEPK